MLQQFFGATKVPAVSTLCESLQLKDTIDGVLERLQTLAGF